MGSDMAVDDANGYDGKVTAFTWKILWAYFAEMDVNHFSLGRFQKFCK